MKTPITKVLVHQEDVLGAYSASKRLKSLNVTKSKLIGQLKKNRLIIHEAECNIPDLQKQLSEVNAEIDLIERGEVVVSEHAILRYLERYMGINLDEVAEKVKELPEDVFVRRGSTIVTILEEKKDE